MSWATVNMTAYLSGRRNKSRGLRGGNLSDKWRDDNQSRGGSWGEVLSELVLKED